MYRSNRPNRAVAIRTAFVGILAMLIGTTATAQMKVGDNVSMKLSGDFGFNYAGSYSNDPTPSSHGHGLMGDATLSGYYFHPNFLSFDFHPYYDRSQSNSESQNIMRSTGFGGQVGLFGGSRFPGSISYGKDFTSNKEFRMAGVPSVTGDASGQSFGVSWSALIPKLPELRANYSIGSGSSSVTGLDSESKSSSKNLTLSSSYVLAGFALQGTASNLRNSFTTPTFLTAEPLSNNSNTTIYSAMAQHRLPLRGNVGLGWTHSTFGSEDQSNFSTSSYSATTSFLPWSKLSISNSVNYTTNVAGYFAEAIEAGVGTPRRLSSAESEALFLNTSAAWRVFSRLSVSAYVNHGEQSFGKRDFTDTQYGGTLNANYANRLLGLLYFSVGLADSANKSGNDNANVIGNIGMNRKFGHWDTQADFNYGQNVNTLYSLFTTSTYSFGGTARRRISQDTFWSASFRGSRTGFVVQEGSGNRAEMYTTTFSWRKNAFTGSYSESQGTAVLSANGGLVSAPAAPIITDEFIYYNARSLGVTASTVIRRKIFVTAGYSNVFGSTTQRLKDVSNNGERYSVRMQYRLRKFSVTGGFTRSVQDFSTMSGPPRVVNSYYLSLSRWFNVF